jgi:hypothetical protein
MAHTKSRLMHMNAIWRGFFFNQMILSARMQSGLHVVLMLLPFAPSLFDGYVGRRATQQCSTQPIRRK